MAVNVECRTQEIGRELFRRCREAHVPFSLNRWLDEQFMLWSLQDESVKTQLFRLVDAFPSLQSPEQINSHVREYLGSVSDQLPSLLRKLVTRWPADGWWGNRLADATKYGVRHLARGLIAGNSLVEAKRVVRQLRRRRLRFSMDVLGEAVVSEVEAQEYAQTYQKLIEGLTECFDDVNVSVKLSSLYSHFDPLDPVGTSRAVRDRLRPILRTAMEHAAFINLDMEQYAFKDMTLRIFREVLEEPEFCGWTGVGIAIQAYLPASAGDLEDLAAWANHRGAPVWVRLVKGAYWDFEITAAAQNNWPVPVFTSKPATDANFETLTTFLFEHHDLLRPAIASHNVRSLTHALTEAERTNIPADQFEFQMLFGMAEPIKAALVGMGHRVRVYTPFGPPLPGMAYLVRRLLENTSNDSFLRAGFFEHLSEEELLMKPTKLPATTSRDFSGNNSAAVAAAPTQAQPASANAATAFRNEPVADFSQPEPREAMRSALSALNLDKTYPAVIGGQRVLADGLIESVNPSHPNQIVGRVACAGIEQAQAAVAAAQAAFPAWRDTPATERAALLRRVAGIMRRRRYELAAWEIVECAKQWREADADVCEAIDYCEFYATEMERLQAPRRRDVAGETNVCFYEPRGVAVVIAPWNFPLAILTGLTAAAVVTGNTAIMKPAEPSVVIGAKLMEMFEEAGAPTGVVNYLPGHGGEIGPVLVQHSDVALIAFTGSREVGLQINRQAAETPGPDHVKFVICEMGGKNAIVVDGDADLDEAIKGVVTSAFGYAGQKCSACSRVVVIEPVYDEFLERLIEATRSLKVGPADDPSTFIGPVIDAKARDRILRMISNETPAFAGEAPSGGFYVAPRIFVDVLPSSLLAQEEIFGPVLAVLRARDLTHALQVANGVPFVLTGGFYSRSPANILHVRREFRIGNLYINRKITGALVDRQPFGGFKMSGIGTKAGGPDYLRQFCLPRTITENAMRHGFAPANGSVRRPS